MILLTKKNLLKALIISIPIVIINFLNRPFEHLLNDVIENPTTEIGMIISISSSVFLFSLSFVIVLVTLRYLNK
ncbi:MAG: hypothetical protein MAG458_00274 [Nitrosopumilus sp.]|nr:hypothetical protein [Nitrosopumilus sp.]